MSKQPEAVPAGKHRKPTPGGSQVRPFDGHSQYNAKTLHSQAVFGLFFGFLGGKTALKMCNELKRPNLGEKGGISPIK
jgi:hypothetical protein